MEACQKSCCYSHAASEKNNPKGEEGAKKPSFEEWNNFEKTEHFLSP